LISPEADPAATDEDRQRLQRDRLLSVADQYGDTPAAVYARLMAANGLLNGGIDHLFEDKAKGTEELRDAIKNFTQVLQSASEPIFTHQATLGLARAHESLNELSEARKYYQQLVDQKGIYSQMAEARLKDLDRKSTKDFYDWFAQQQPRPRAEGLPGIPGLGPEFNLDSAAPPVDLDLSNPFTGKTDPGKAGTESKDVVPPTAVESEKAAGDKSAESPATSPAPTSERAGKDVP
jgi:hypothetical protein